MFNRKTAQLSAFRRAGEGVLAAVVATLVTLAIFLVLPALQSVTQPRLDKNLALSQVDTVEPPPPPPPPEAPEEVKPEDPPPPPPEMEESVPPLDLSQIELALSGGIGEGFIGDFAARLSAAGLAGGVGDAVEEIFSLADLDQPPRPVFQPAPEYPADLRRRGADGTVHIIFIVDKEGRVKNPLVQKSTNPAFDNVALNAVRRWRFEPGKRGGSPVRFRMRAPITFMPR